MAHRPRVPLLPFDLEKPKERELFEQMRMDVWIYVVHAEVDFLRSMFRDYKKHRLTRRFFEKMVENAMDCDTYEMWEERKKSRKPLTIDEENFYISHICNRYTPGHWFKYFLSPMEYLQDTQMPGLRLTPDGIEALDEYGRQR